jgi:diguanylate cyclase
MEFIRHAKLFRWLSTLKFKIIAMAVATAVLAAAAAMHMTLQSTRADLTRLLIDNERDGSERMAAMLASKLETLQLTLRIVGQNTHPAQWAQPEAMAAMLLERPVLGALFGSAFVAAPDGTMLARVENGRASAELPVIGDRAYFKQVIATGKPVISQPLRGKVSGVPIVVIAVPALGSDGRVVGIVAGSLALQSTSLLANLIGMAPRDGSRMLVVDQAGTLLAHPNPARLLGKAADEPGLSEPFREWSAAGRPGGRTILDAENMVAMTTITGSPWMLVHITPAAMALAPLTHARLTAWRAALVVGGVAGVLAGLLAWYLTQPISRLRARAQQMLLEGTPADIGWPRETGEIGQLAKAFQLVVAQRQQRQRETEALLVQLEAVLDHAEVGIALTRNGRFELVSRQFCRTFRSERAQLVGQSTRVIYSSDEAYETLSARAGPAFMVHGACDGELELARRGGQPIGSSTAAGQSGRANQCGIGQAPDQPRFADLRSDRVVRHGGRGNDGERLAPTRPVGRPSLDRRFRHGAFQPVASAHVAGRRTQDRPQLCARPRDERRGSHGRECGDPARQGAQSQGRGRGRRNRGTEPHPRRFRLRPAQGYLFAKPMSAKALALWATDNVGPRSMNFRASIFTETEFQETAPDHCP